MINYLYQTKHFLSIILFITISTGNSSCTRQVTAEPSNLPHAKIGQYYQQDITINVSEIPFVSTGPMTNLKITHNFPKDMNVSIEQQEKYSRVIVIKGTPKYTGNYVFNISSGFYGGGATRLDKNFNFIVE